MTTPPVRLLTRLSCDDEDSSLASFAVVRIDADRAKKLLDLHVRVNVFLTALAKDDLVTPYFRPSFGSELAHFDAYEMNDAFENVVGEHQVVEIGADDSAGGDDAVRMECFRVEIGDSGFQFSSLPKYGSGRYVTNEITLDALKKIAGV